MKRADLIRRVSRAAREAGISWTRLRSTGRHDMWECDGMRIPIPRHRELNDRAAVEILRDLEAKLGRNWWR